MDLEKLRRFEQITQELEELNYEIEAYLNPICTALNYYQVKDVVVFEDSLCAHFVWYGAYQSEDQVFVEIPLDWLNRYNQKEIAEKIKEVWKKEREEARKEEEEKREKIELAKLKELKEKYEGKDEAISTS